MMPSTGTASPTFTGTVTTPNLTIGSGNKIKFANNDYIRYDDANGVGRFHFDSDGGTNNSSVQAATFVGALSGNATTATTATTTTGNAGSSTTTLFLDSRANPNPVNRPTATIAEWRAKPRQNCFELCEASAARDYLGAGNFWGISPL